MSLLMLDKVTPPSKASATGQAFVGPLTSVLTAMFLEITAPSKLGTTNLNKIQMGCNFYNTGLISSTHLFTQNLCNGRIKLLLHEV